MMAATSARASRSGAYAPCAASSSSPSATRLAGGSGRAGGARTGRARAVVRASSVQLASALLPRAASREAFMAEMYQWASTMTQVRAARSRRAFARASGPRRVAARVTD